MIQTFSTAFELRQSLIDVLTATPNLLGTFTEDENTGDQAIWVLPPEPPKGVDGIRCLIQRTPEGEASILGSRQVQRQQYWKVILTNFDVDSKLLADAKQRLETRYLLAPSLQPSYLSPTTVNYEELTVWIWSPVVIDRGN